jgi:predicted HicB family RNase H-like nuclease
LANIASEVDQEVSGRGGSDAMMEYKGYIAKVVFDGGAGVFHGEVLNLRDVIAFEGKTVAGLRKAFRDSVDDYLEFCATRKEVPEKPCRGRFVLRLDPNLHRAIATKASLENKSLNAWVQEVLQSAVRSRPMRA